MSPKLLKFQDLNKIENDRGRFYQLPSGTWVPSITTILSHSSKDFINDWKNRIGNDEADKITQKAAKRGTAIHDLCEEFLLTSNVEQFPNPLLKDDFLKIKPFLKTIDQPIIIEQTLFSEKLKLAGRTDCVAIYRDELTIIDFKTSRKAKKPEWIENYFIQACAYAIMLFEMTGMKANKYIIAIVSDELNQPQLFTGITWNHINRLKEIRKSFPNYDIKDIT